MTYSELSYIHLATIIPAFFIGTYLLLSRKGTPIHKALGKMYMSLMLVTAVVTLFMPAVVGARLLNHFGFIHIFSLFTIYSVPKAYFAARHGNIKQHIGNMVGLYIGGLLIAGAFAFMPDRSLYRWLIAPLLQ